MKILNLIIFGRLAAVLAIADGCQQQIQMNNDDRLLQMYRRSLIHNGPLISKEHLYSKQLRIFILGKHYPKAIIRQSINRVF